jgi:hypothetical protein
VQNLPSNPQTQDDYGAMNDNLAEIWHLLSPKLCHNLLHFANRQKRMFLMIGLMFISLEYSVAADLKYIGICEENYFFDMPVFK